VLRKRAASEGGSTLHALIDAAQNSDSIISRREAFVCFRKLLSCGIKNIRLLSVSCFGQIHPSNRAEVSKVEENSQNEEHDEQKKQTEKQGFTFGKHLPDPRDFEYAKL